MNPEYTIRVFFNSKSPADATFVGASSFTLHVRRPGPEFMETGQG